jgi:hypothetical protein
MASADCGEVVIADSSSATDHQWFCLGLDRFLWITWATVAHGMVWSMICSTVLGWTLAVLADTAKVQ